VTTKVGFLHDQALNLGTVFSETDSESKYSVEAEQTNSEIDNDSAELSIIDFDTSQALDSTNGMKIINVNTGPLLDKHDSYRTCESEIEDTDLGVARFALKDYADSSSNNKSKDEYWCANTFQPGYDIESLPDTLIHNGHWNGSVMMYVFTDVNPSDSDKQDIYVKTRNESTKSWAGAPVLVNTVSNKIYKGGSAKAIENYPNFCTVPNLGTLLFYFGTTENSQGEGGDAGHSNELIHISITKDDGVTWESYGNFVIDPFYGDVAPPQSSALASEKTAVLKAIYYNNKLIVGMMLQGTDSSTVTIQERVGWGSSSTSDSFTYTTQYPIKQDTVSPPTLTLRKNGTGTVGSGTQVAADDGSGTITGTNVTGSITDYKAGTIEFNETAGEWGANDSVEVEYEIGGLHFYRILNVMYSNDLGKSWTTVPYEFIQGSYEGSTPAGDYLLGDPTSSSYRYCLPSSFGLGYDIYSDKVVLVLRSSGLYRWENFDYPYNFENIENTYFFYNRSDDLFEWGSSKIKGRTYKLLDSYHIDSLDKYAVYEYSSYVGNPADWYVDGDTLHQDANINGPSYTAGQAKGGTHLILNRENPTLNRTIGVHVDLMTTSTGTFGIAFCRSDQNNMYAVTFDCANNATAGTCVMYLKKVLSGTESTLSSATIEFPQSSWIELSITFDLYDIITVSVNGVGKIASTDNTVTRIANKIALISNSQAGCEFDNLGLHTSRTIKTLIGGGFSAQSGWYNESRPQVGANIDLTNDNFGQSWIAADVLNIDLGNGTFFNYVHCGIAFQKYKLTRDVERVEGKFLATDTFSVVFSDNDHYEKDIQNYMSLQDYGLFITHYNTGTYNTRRVKPTLESFEWYKDDPNFFIYRDNDGYYQYSNALIERSQYSDRNLFSTLGSTWHCMTYTVQPQYAGWEESPSFSYTQENRYILNVAKDHYFLQSFDPNSSTLSTNGSLSMPVVNFDYEYRGMTAFCKTISDSGNDTNATRTLFEATIPGYYTSFGKARIRVRASDAASAGFSVDYYNYTGTAWVNLGSLTGLDIKNTWWDISIFLLAIRRSYYQDLRLSVYAREEGSSRWQTVIEDQIVNIYADSTPTSEVKFGAFDASAETNNRQKFKFCGYSDVCRYDPAVYKIRGETLQSGERIYGTKGIVYTVSGGLSIEGDEWTLTDLNRRDNSKESIVERPSVLWISNDDSADKSIIIDAQHELEYDTLVLTDVNCKQIVFESDDNSSFSSPTIQATLDMAEYSAIPFSTDLNKEDIMNIVTNNIFKINQFLDRIAFVTYSTTIEKAFRIIRNTHNKIIYDENGAAPPLPTTATTGTLDLLSKNIAVKFSSRYRDRYFRITMKKSTYEYPTPEGAFQIGRAAIGVFDQLQENPEYPEVTETIHKNKMIKLASNVNKQKRKDSPTTQKTLSFKSIDSYNQRGFLNQLQTIFDNVDGYKPVFYIPDIEEYVLTGTPAGTYTLNVFPFYYADKINYPEKWGNLSDVTLVLKEYR